MIMKQAGMNKVQRWESDYTISLSSYQKPNTDVLPDQNKRSNFTLNRSLIQE